MEFLNNLLNQYKVKKTSGIILYILTLLFFCSKLIYIKKDKIIKTKEENFISSE